MPHLLSTTNKGPCIADSEGYESRLLVNSPLWLIGTALLIFCLSSYPMMLPGLDIWWHSAMTEAPSEVLPQTLSAVRLSWHHFWHHILAMVGFIDVFDRALFIHKIQTPITLSLIMASAYLALRVITFQWIFEKRLIVLASMLSAITWALLHGTASTPHGGNPDTPLVQSWLVWYSVNYQISLPLYFAATSALLYALSAASNQRKRLLAGAASVVLIGIGTLLHAAETANFVLCLALLALLYLRGRYAWAIAIAMAIFLGLVLWMALSFSYVMPDLLKYVFMGNWGTLKEEILRRGMMQIEGGLNRAATGWHILYTISLLSLLVTGYLLKYSKKRPIETGLDHRALIFVTFTSLMPLGMLFTYPAGMLSMLTTELIAYRFAFGSFLFIAIPLFGLTLIQRIGISARPYRSLVLVIGFGLVTAAATSYSYIAEPRQAMYRYANSLVYSLDQKRSHFNLDAIKRTQLARLAQGLRKQPQQEPVCTDLRTAYYLFFVERYRAPVLPISLAYLPGYQFSQAPCSYSPKNERLVMLGLMDDLPLWDR